MFNNRRAKILLCRSEEWAQNQQLAYKSGFRHKRTILPLTRDFRYHPTINYQPAWLDNERRKYNEKYHGNKHSLIKKDKPLSKKSQASVYEYCSQLASKLLVRVIRNNVPVSQNPSQDFLLTKNLYHILSQKASCDYPLGFISMYGKSFIEHTITSSLCTTYSRLRAIHLQEILAIVCGLQNISQAAQQIGMVKQLSLSSDIQLWRELNLLNIQKESILKLMHTNVNVGEDVSQQKKILKYINSQIKRRSAAEKEDLTPTIEWLRNHFFAWLCYFMLSRGVECANQLVNYLLVGSANRDFYHSHPLEKNKSDSEEVLSSSGGWSAAVPPVDAIFEKSRSKNKDVPSYILRAINPANALKEAQIILRYSHAVPIALRDPLINFRESHASFGSTGTAQGFGRYKLTKETLKGVDFVCNDTVLGTGTGSNIQSAMQESCLHMAQNFYAMRQK